MVFFFTTVAMKFEAISTYLMISLLTSANAIRKTYTLMLIIDSHLGTKFHQELYNECVKTFEDLLTRSNSLKEKLKA